MSRKCINDNLAEFSNVRTHSPFLSYKNLIKDRLPEVTLWYMPLGRTATRQLSRLWSLCLECMSSEGWLLCCILREV